MQRGQTIEGKAKQFNDEMLGRIDLDSYLNEIGCYHEERWTIQPFPIPSPTPVTHTFHRDHNEVDVTNFGDAVRQRIVIQPGLHVELEDTADGREAKVAAALLLIEGLRMQKEAEERAYTAQQRLLNETRKREERQHEDLLVFWGRMGRKARATFATANPEVAKRCEELEREREAERRADSYDYNW